VEHKAKKVVKLFKDYDMEIKYHPGKANIVVDALSRKSTGLLAYLLTQEKKLLKEFEELQIRIALPGDR